MFFVPAMGKLLIQKNSTREVGLLLCLYLIMCFRRLWNRSAGRVWKGLEIQARESLECHTQRWTAHSSWSSENQNADRNAERKGLVQEVSVKNKYYIGSWIWIRDHYVTFWHKRLSTFCPHPENLQKTKIKGDELINLAEDISRQSKMQGVAWVLLTMKVVIWKARCIVRIWSK